MNTGNQNNEIEGRRPLKTRDVGLTKACAIWLSNRNITPNQISIFSMAFAALAALCFVLIPLYTSSSDYAEIGYSPDVASWLLPLMAAVFIQCRLLCNLFDGMVAVEGGKSTFSGELFNEIPDRIADLLILIAAGYAIIAVSWSPVVGWSAGLLAVMTAYVRTLGASIGAPMDFQGPMAKPHRMALMTVACVLTMFEGYVWPPGYSLLLALIGIVAGCIVTIVLRSRRAYLFLENQQKSVEELDNV
jgi:phosphatidylglycerophosphate synthase